MCLAQYFKDCGWDTSISCPPYLVFKERAGVLIISDARKIVDLNSVKLVPYQASGFFASSDSSSH